METRVIDSKKFEPVARGPRSSRYKKVVEDFLALKPGKGLEVVDGLGKDINKARARIQTAVRSALNACGDKRAFSCRAGKTGTVLLEMKEVAKPRPVRKKTAKKKKSRKR